MLQHTTEAIWEIVEEDAAHFLRVDLGKTVRPNIDDSGGRKGANYTRGGLIELNVQLE